MTDNRDSLAALPIVDRVAAGIELLDREVPGWDERINLAELDLMDCSYCILGQLFGEYADGRRALDLQWPGPVPFGFSLHPDDPSTYDELTDAWLTAIRARRQAVTG